MNSGDYPAEQRWKVGNEFLPFHPQASHVCPDYRDGWNACYEAGRTHALDVSKLEHIYEGDCPDEQQPDAFDPQCYACQAIRAMNGKT